MLVKNAIRSSQNGWFLHLIYQGVTELLTYIGIYTQHLSLVVRAKIIPTRWIKEGELSVKDLRMDLVGYQKLLLHVPETYQLKAQSLKTAGWPHTDFVIIGRRAGPWFNIKMTSYQYRKSHCGDKMILRPSYLQNGTSYTTTMTSLYWIRAQVATSNDKVGIMTTVVVSDDHMYFNGSYIFQDYCFLTWDEFPWGNSKHVVSR